MSTKKKVHKEKKEGLEISGKKQQNSTTKKIV